MRITTYEDKSRSGRVHDHAVPLGKCIASVLDVRCWCTTERKVAGMTAVSQGDCICPEAHQLLSVMVLGILSGVCSRFRYGNVMNMSKKAIYDQLISDYGEKFTKDEAQYAVDHLE